MRTADLDFYLPPDLIAQQPTAVRSASRLLHYKRADRSVTHRTFSDLPSSLGPGNLMVFNDARVVPAKFLLRKPTGGAVEGLFLSESSPGVWRVMLRNLGRYAGPLVFAGDETVSVRPVRKHTGGEYEIRLDPPMPAAEILDRVGRMPLPPYIRRGRDGDALDAADRANYQTVYAATPGSVAAPTAGLHFTPAVLAGLDSVGVERTAVTLHVGTGTFKPVTVDDLADHVMHTERYEVTAAAAVALNGAEQAERRIVAVGTTACRVLESWPNAPWSAAASETSILISPPYRWKRVGALVTNFHLPKSTLVALVAAMVGIEEQRRIYEIAIGEKYRFFSYGDAMLIE